MCDLEGPTTCQVIGLHWSIDVFKGARHVENGGVICLLPLQTWKINRNVNGNRAAKIIDMLGISGAGLLNEDLYLALGGNLVKGDASSSVRLASEDLVSQVLTTVGELKAGSDNDGRAIFKTSTAKDSRKKGFTKIGFMKALNTLGHDPAVVGGVPHKWLDWSKS
ncbi:hypothetical protein Cgig2_018427 [Carnegiea gigantea]|uniref:Uncharacterized protein n=1 Tax=Carnegiea gigantea TaxID=171969 RepID=A0A9Q1JL40_9CARY|nr:hypothetical protein Cgig2_018427 [Carnegiea gigantea]